MNKPYFFLIYWRHKRLKSTIDLLLIYESDLFNPLMHNVPKWLDTI